MSKTVKNEQYYLYQIWLQMRARCNNPNHKRYKWYGTKGIKVCKEWNSFQQFVKDIGPRPNSHSLDRIDNSKGYYKENCRWATVQQQIHNRSNHKIIKFAGLSLNLKQWATLLRISNRFYPTFRARIRIGWTLPRAACTVFMGRIK